MFNVLVYCILAFLFIAIDFTTAFSSYIHDKMTRTEMQTIFGAMTSQATYKIFPMSLSGMERGLKSNETIRCTLSLDDEKIYLNLKPTAQYLATSNLPVWSAVSDDDAYLKIRYDPLTTAMRGVGEFAMYQDADNGAALAVYTDPLEEIVIDGIIGARYRIRSMPKRLTADLLKEVGDVREIPNVMGGAIISDEDTGFYAVTDIPLQIPAFGLFSSHDESHEKKKRPEGNGTTLNGEETLSVTTSRPPLEGESDERKKRGKRHGEKSKKTTKVSQTVYPEILIVLTHDVVSGHTRTEMLRFVLAYWNAMDLLYRKIHEPQIHLNIAGVIIAADSKATPYIPDEATPRIGNLDTVMWKMGRYFYKDRVRFPTKRYDTIVAMTSKYVCEDSTNLCTTGNTPGYAKRIPVCSSEANMTTTGIVSNTMIIQFNGGFGVEDVFLVQNNNGHGKKADCVSRDDDMAINAFDLYECSKKLYSRTLASKESKCLRNKPRSIRPADKVMPGKWLSLDGQCQNEGFEGSCQLKKHVGPCEAKGCKAEESENCVRSKRIPLSGSKCGTKKYCNKNRECVRE